MTVRASMFTRAPIALLIIVLTVAASACGNNGATAGPSGPSTTTTPLDVTLEGLDASIIVAAHEQVINQIYERSLPSIAHIRVVQRVGGRGMDPFGLEEGDLFRRGEGSGFIWDQEGRIVTNYHVIADAEVVKVFLADGTEVEAEILGLDQDSDLAVLEVDVPEDRLVPLTLGDSSTLAVGQVALAIGNPFGQEFTITSGIVSALGRTISSGSSAFSIPEVIQTDAAVNPGNSGGPLLDRRGRVIGINTQIATLSGSNAGVGFAIPINTAKTVVPELISKGRFEYAWLGISGQRVNSEVASLMDLPPGTQGALIIDVTKDSPADKAGLRGGDRTATVRGATFQLGGDVITSIDDTPVTGVDDLIAYLNQHTRPGHEVELEIIRDGETGQTVTVDLGTRPDVR